MINIFISFATEDFVTPAHNNILKRLASLLSSRKITGSFHLTGELARSLRDGNRLDVIDALREHEIGYHCNTHGAYPFIGSICENRTWDSAIEELMRTEARGLHDIEQIMGKRPCYYVTEFTKAPQLICALRGLGIDLLGLAFLPATSEAPFSWYTGSLCYTGSMMGVESPPRPNRLQEMKQEFDTIYHQEKSKAGHGVIKLFNHPYKFAYNNAISSWDKENNIYQKYDLHSPWHIPKQALYDQKVTDTLFMEFEQLLDYILEKDDVQFLSTAQVAQSYRHNLPTFIPYTLFQQLLQNMSNQISWQQAASSYFSPAEIMALMTYALTYYASNANQPEILPVRHPLGPTTINLQPLAESIKIPLQSILNDIVRIDRELTFSHQLPSALALGGFNIPLASAYQAFAEVLTHPNPLAAEITFKPCPPLPIAASESYLNETTWTKASYPAGFTGATICKHAKLQSWTLKPAGHSS